MKGMKKDTASKSEHKHSKKHRKSSKKKERGILPYISNPLIYVLISLIVVLPVFMGFTKGAVSFVHKVQKDYSIDFNDVSINTDKFDNNTLVYENDRIGACEKVGVLKYESVGIISDVYYGINRVSLREGIGLSSKSTFDSFKSKLSLAGYSTRALKGLSNAKAGDIITFETTDKIYQYEVESNTVSANPEVQSSSVMVISCDDSSKAFSAYSKQKRYVVASFKSMRDKKGE